MNALPWAIAAVRGPYRIHSKWCFVAVSVCMAYLWIGGCDWSADRNPYLACSSNLGSIRLFLLELAKAVGPSGLRGLDFSPAGTGWYRLGTVASTGRPLPCPLASDEDGYGYVLNPRLFYHRISEIADQDWLIADSAPRHNGYYLAITKAGHVYRTKLLL